MKRLQLIRIGITVLCTATTLIGNAGPWVKKSDNLQFQPGRWGGMSFVGSNNKIYLTGGYSNMSYQTDMQEYDPAAGSWKIKGALPATGPTNRSSGVAFTVNGKSFVGLGAQDFLSISGTQKNLTDLWEYDVANDKWTQRKSLPDSGRTEACVFVVNNKAYVVGGNGKFTGGGAVTNEVWEYDPAGDKWNKKANYPLANLSNASAFAIGGKGYVTGGLQGGTAVKNTYEYDPVADKWTPKADLLDSARYGMVAFALNNYGYVGLGSTGIGGSTQYKSTFYFYDAAADKWGFLHGAFSQPARNFGVAGVANNKAYVGCGWRIDNSVQTYFRDWYEGDIASMLDVQGVNNTKNTLSVYPNPATTVINIDMPQRNGTYTYSIYNLTGQLATSGVLPASNNIDVSQLVTGNYILEVATQSETLRSIISVNR